MLLLLFGSVVGIILGLSIELSLWMALYFLLMITLCYFFHVNIKKVFIFFLCIIGFFFYTKETMYYYDTKYLDGNMEDDITILSYPCEKQNSNRYIGQNDKKDKFFIYLPKEDSFQKGDKIHIKGNFVLPNIARNKGGFDYRRYCNSQKIYGSVFVKKFDKIEVGRFHFIFWIQNKIHDSFEKLFPQNEMGLILGMMIGETNDISETTLEDFQKTGMTHLIAVSGSNVMYVLVSVQFLCNKLWGKRKTYGIAIFVLIVFMCISGATSSVTRATIMAILTLLAEIFYQKANPIQNLAISGCILMSIHPLILCDIGFVLSFGGTVGILLLSEKLQLLFQKWKKFSNIIATTLSAQLTLAPIMAFYFNTFSIIAILANLVVVPISGFITILGFIVFFISLISFPLATILSKALFSLIYFVIAIANLFSKISFSMIKVITPNYLEIIFFYVILFYILEIIPNLKQKENNFFYHHKLKVIVISSILFLFIELFYYNFPRNYITIHCLDVGQGDAFYIHTTHHQNILVDGGGSETYDVGKNIVIPFLLDQRVLTIDAIFSSHSDTDHLDGILTVMENLKVKKIYIAKGAKGYENLYAIAKKMNTQVIEVKEGDIITIDGIIFKVVGPAKTISSQDVNAYSLVLKMQYQNKSMLFTGDITQEAEERMQNVTADILKVAHHGSNTSSSLKFIAKVHPTISIISVEKNNAYGHPNQEVIKRLERYSKIYTTAKQGEIIIHMGKDWIKVE